ncbi:hypothetical protein [Paenibacillus sp. QZ-Y1]|uniref:hypothetical protein n=1 Tax=Paenibacillus sp. QZ-Y1 TaxID=3414511 RepID=UPI003F794644
MDYNIGKSVDLRQVQPPVIAFIAMTGGFLYVFRIYSRDFRQYWLTVELQTHMQNGHMGVEIGGRERK